MRTQRKSDMFLEGSSVRILTFEVSLGKSELFTMGINIQKIKEILDVGDIEIQSLTPNYWPLVGLLNLRHLSVPLLDLRHFLGRRREEDEFGVRGRRIIVCEFQRLHLGILVENIHKIRQFENSLIQPMPEVLSTFPGNIFNGVLEDEGRFIKLLDIEYILTQLNVDVAPEKESQSPKDDLLSDKTILLVEDSKLFQKKLMGFFTENGAKVFLAENGEEGLAKLKELDGKVDLVFTDIEMPVLNGIGMVRKLRSNESWAKIPVIFNTSISNPGLVEDIQAEGLGHYIVKFDEKHITEVISRIFRPI